MLTFIFLFLIILIPGLIFLIQGPPYVPSNDNFTKTVVEEVKKLKPKKILDMGSGDGKLVIALAQAGFKAEGVELNPWLVLRSKRAIRKLGLEHKATIRWGNFWRYDTSSYDIVVLYVIKHIMPRLEEKLTTELHKGSYIISNYFVFPNLKPVKSDGRMRVYKV